MTATGVVGIAAVGILGYDVVWPLVYRALPGVRPVLDGALTVVAFVIPFVIGVVLLGPGRAEMVDGASVVVQVAVTIVMVVAIYGVFGLAGAGVGRRWMRRPRARLSVR